MPPLPTLVLTRPEVASRRVAEQYAGPVVISPVLRIESAGAMVDPRDYAGVILTSANAVAALPDLAGLPAYVVGARTAAVCGAKVQLVARDAEDLIKRIRAQGPLLHAHGRETRGDIADRLTSAGIETHSVVVYDQIALPLNREARDVLSLGDPAILPLWSPRSATLVGEQTGGVPASVRVIALSEAVAEAWREATGAQAHICPAPSGEAMMLQIDAAARG